MSLSILARSKSDDGNQLTVEEPNGDGLRVFQDRDGTVTLFLYTEIFYFRRRLQPDAACRGLPGDGPGVLRFGFGSVCDNTKGSEGKKKEQKKRKEQRGLTPLFPSESATETKFIARSFGRADCKFIWSVDRFLKRK